MPHCSAIKVVLFQSFLRTLLVQLISYLHSTSTWFRQGDMHNDASSLGFPGEWKASVWESGGLGFSPNSEIK